MWQPWLGNRLEQNLCCLVERRGLPQSLQTNEQYHEPFLPHDFEIIHYNHRTKRPVFRLVEIFRTFCAPPKVQYCIYNNTPPSPNAKPDKSNPRKHPPILGEQFLMLYTLPYLEEARCWWCSWLRQCATSRKVAGSIHDVVIRIFLPAAIWPWG